MRPVRGSSLGVGEGARGGRGSRDHPRWSGDPGEVNVFLLKTKGVLFFHLLTPFPKSFIWKEKKLLFPKTAAVGCNLSRARV